MALRDINIFEKHVEKIVLGAAGAGAIFMFYLASQKVSVDVQGVSDPVGPGDVEAVIHQALGDPLPPLSPDQLKVLENKHDLTVEESKAVIEAYGKPNVQVPDLVAIYRRLSSEQPLDSGLVQVAVPSIGAANYSPQHITVDNNGPRTAYKTPDAPAPEGSFLHADSTQFQVTTVDPASIVLPLPPGTMLPTAEKKVVVIDGWIPVGQMLKQMLQERDPKARIPSDRMRAIVQNIKVTRQEILPGGRATAPVTVPPPKNSTPVEPVAWGALTSDDVPTAMDGLDAQFKQIVLPDFDRDAQGVPIPPPIIAHPVPDKIDQESRELQAAIDAARAGGVVSSPMGRPAIQGAPPPPPTPAAAATATPATMLPNDAAQIKVLPVIPFTFWDETIKPGHTYRYQVTVEFVNPLFGWKQGLKNEDDKSKPFLAAAPITIEKDVHVNSDVEFFISGAGRTGEVEVGVYKHANGRWYYKDLSIPVGARIAGSIPVPDQGPNQTMDVDTDYTIVDQQATRAGSSIGGASVYVVLRDPQGNLVTRDSATDSNNPEKSVLAQDVRKATSTAPATEPSASVVAPPAPIRSGGTTRPSPSRGVPQVQGAPPPRSGR